MSSGFISKLIHIILPNRCACCGRLLTDGDICNKCKISLPYRGDKVCNKCGQPISSCECKTRNYLFNGITSPFLYEGVARNGIFGLKFRNRTSAAEFFGREMVKELNLRTPEIIERCDIICSVPASVMGERERGYNQADLLARVVAREIDKLYYPAALQRIKENETQHSINNFSDRYNNVRGVYSTAGQRFDGKNVIIVDDVKTSGATLNECAKRLRLAGAKTVWCLTATIKHMKNK